MTLRVERRGSVIAIGEHGSGYANVSGVRVGTLTSTSLGDVSSLGDVCELCAASNGTDGQGARSRRETVDSRPSIYRTFAYIGLTSRNSTWSTRGSFLLVRTNLRSSTGPGEFSHEGIDVPQDERR